MGWQVLVGDIANPNVGNCIWHYVLLKTNWNNDKEYNEWNERKRLRPNKHDEVASVLFDFNIGLDDNNDNSTRWNWIVITIKQ